MYIFLFLFFLSFVLGIFQNKALASNPRVWINFKQKNNSCVFLVFLLLLFACVSGFRYKMGGTDYAYYEYFYSKIYGQTNFFNAIQSSEYEVGYTAFVYFCSNVLHLSYNGSLVLESFILYLLMYVGLKRYMPNWGIFLMFFMYKMFFYVTFVAMRQAFTVVGFFLLLRFLEERKFIKYYLSLLLVASFHYGALLLFVLYPLFGLNITKRKLVLFGNVFALSTLFSGITGSLLNVVVSMLGLTALEDKAAGYSSSDVSLSILYTIEYFIIYILLVKNYDKIHAKFKQAGFVTLLFLIVLPIVTLFRSTLIFVRELPYFYPAYAILIYYIYAVSKKKMLIYLAFSVVCLLGVIKYMLQFDNGHFLEYRTWLFNSNVQFFS